jgi:hypothetical protein
MLFRTSDIVLIALMVTSAAFTYVTKHEVENRLERMRKIEAQIRLERETIDLVRADLSLLTQPFRLQKLAEIYQDELQLYPVEATQIVAAEDLPVRMESDPIPETLRDFAGAGDDKTVTGSTAR